MSSRGRNPSRPSNTGFKVVPAHAPHSAYLGKGKREPSKSHLFEYGLEPDISFSTTFFSVRSNAQPVAKKLKESLIERARIKKSFAKALKKEGLQSERLGRGQDSGPAQGYDGNGPARGSLLRGRGSGRGGPSGGRGRGASRSSVIKQDGVRELVQLSRKNKSNNNDPSSTPTNTTASTATRTPAPKRTAVPESESDESELESGEERAPRPSKARGAGAGSNSAPNENDDEDGDDDDGFFDDDDEVEGDMIDSRVSLRGNKPKGKGRADRADPSL
jgi:hypothetical protein